MTPTLRLPLPADYDALVSWVRDAAACAHWAGPLLRFPFSATELPLLLSGEGASSFSLVNSAGEFLGFGQLVEKSPSVMRLARIIVAPHVRGIGLGRALCRLLLAKAANHATAEVITLGVYRDNAAAISLYASLGFVEAPPHPRPEVLSMGKSLPRG